MAIQNVLEVGLSMSLGRTSAGTANNASNQAKALCTRGTARAVDILGRFSTAVGVIALQPALQRSTDRCVLSLKVFGLPAGKPFALVRLAEGRFSAAVLPKYFDSLGELSQRAGICGWLWPTKSRLEGIPRHSPSLSVGASPAQMALVRHACVALGTAGVLRWCVSPLCKGCWWHHTAKQDGERGTCALLHNFSGEPGSLAVIGNAFERLSVPSLARPEKDPLLFPPAFTYMMRYRTVSCFS